MIPIGHQGFLVPTPGGVYPILNPLNSINRVMVTSAANPLISHGVVAAQGTTAQAPMLVPPAMQAEISAANRSPHSNSSAGDQSAWTQHTTPEGKVYYYNRATKQSSWTKPEDHMQKCVWREYKTAEGKSYYYNVETKTTTWTLPEGEEIQPASSKDRNMSTDSPSTRYELKSKDDTSTSDLDKAMMATLAKLDQSPVTSSSTVMEQQVDSRDAVYDVDKELKKRQGDRFRELLRDKYNDGKISSNCSWDHAVKYVQHDPRFRIITKMSEKKQLFNAWKVQRQKEEREEKRLAIKKAKDDYEEWLKSLPKMKILSFRYTKAEDLYGSEPVWKAVSEGDRRDIFRDVKNFLEKDDEEKNAALRRRNIQALDDILQGMPEITCKTTWAQAQRLLIENPAFAKDATLQGMDKEDALIVFEEHIRSAEKSVEKEKDEEERGKRRRERKVREAFTDLLKELQSRGELSSVSKWKEICPALIVDDRFNDLLHQEGTTALDLFKFYVEDLKSQFGQDRRIIKDILKDANKTVEKSTTFDELSKWILVDERGKSVDMGNMKLVYNSYVDKAIGKEKDIEREIERKKKRLETNFHNALRSLEPPVTPSSEWSQICSLIENNEAYSAIEEEELREEFFHSFVKTISEACGHYHSSSKKKKKDKKKRRKDEESDTDSEPKSKKKKKHRSSDEADRDRDERKKKKKPRRHSRSRSRSRSESPDRDEKSSSKHRHRRDSSSSKVVHEEESFDDLEMKRNELLQELERSQEGERE